MCRCQMPEVMMLWWTTGTQTGTPLDHIQRIIDLLHADHSRSLSCGLSLQLPLCRHCDAV